MELCPSLQSQPLLSEMVVVDWRDPIVEALGHRPESPYIEYVWLSVLGPATVWAYRRLSCLAATAPGDLFWVEGLRISERFKLTHSTKRRLQWSWERL